jgi:CRISPR-associated protein Csy2
MMEDGLLILSHMKVENANAIAGLTWGFPAITNFLGFVHALSRKLPREMELTLTGCGVICHSHQVQAHQPKGWGDHLFGLTRNPLTSKGTPPSFAEEGRMHMEVSLLIPVEGDLDDIDDLEEVRQRIKQLVFSQRMAGGSIISIGSVHLEEPPEDEEGLVIYSRRWFRKLLPGFTLVQRSDLMSEHLRKYQEQNPDAEALDAWMDFSALKYKAELPDDRNNSEDDIKWHYLPKPAKGWLVPIPIGYRGISDLYKPDEVANTRDNVTPFRFVESVYSIGEWLSPHRLEDMKQIFWRYSTEPDSGWYLCENDYKLK